MSSSPSRKSSGIGYHFSDADSNAPNWQIADFIARDKRNNPVVSRWKRLDGLQ
jgi:hypothetical protein